MEKKIISYALYGDKPKYNIGIIVNCLLAKKYLGGWMCRIHYDETVPKGTINFLRKLDNVELKFQNEKSINGFGMWWRMFPMDDDDVDVVISRDADSLLCERDSYALNEWLKSDKNFHVIRDHCHHRSPIMGGTWGCRNHINKGIIELLFEAIKKNPEWASNDQIFLNTYVYKKMRDEMKTLFVHGILNPPMEKEEFAVNIPELNYDNDDNISIKTISDMHGNTCSMCGNIHSPFIGSQINNYPKKTIDYLKKMKNNFNIIDNIPGLE